MRVSSLILLRMRNVADKILEEIKRTSCVHFFFLKIPLFKR